MLNVATAFVFAAVTLLFYAAFSLAFSEDRRVARRLKGLSEYEIAQARSAEPVLNPFMNRVIRPAFTALGRGARRLWPSAYMRHLRSKLERAGLPRGLYADRIVLAKLLAAVGTAGLLVAIGALLGWRAGTTVFLGVFLGILGFFAPDFWLDSRIARRRHAIVRALPEMLDMLTISVEAGLGFDAALSKVVRSSSGPLAEEFGRVIQETQAGASRRSALSSFATRVDMPEIHSFSGALVQADLFGVSIAQVLRAQASEMRLVRRQHAEEIAQKAPVKMIVPLIFCILPATMIVILGPVVLRIMGVFGF